MSESTVPTATNTKVKNEMHDKCKQVVVFHNHLVKFFKSLSTTCPEFKREIAKCVRYYNECDRYEYIGKTLKLMEPHIKRVSQYDEGIFSNDYQKGSLKLVPGLDLKKIFHFINDSDEFDKDDAAATKKAIFNHLQSIYISGELAVGQIDKFNKAMDKQKTMLMDMLKNLNLEAALKDKIEKLAADEKEAEGKGGFDLSQLNKLGDLFGEDNFIFQLAKDVAEEINLGNEDLSSPVDAINLLFANKGQRLQELIVTVGEKIEQKVRSGEIDQAKLYEHAKNMKEKIQGIVGNIPELKGLSDPSQMTKMFADGFSELSAEDQAKFADIKALLDVESPDMTKWTEEQRTKFEEYTKLVFSRRASSAETEAAAESIDIDKELADVKEEE